MLATSLRGVRSMDGFVFVPFALAALAGGFVSGFSGFAMGLVVSGVWLHIITPMQNATLIAGYGLLTQGYGILKLRHVLDLRRAWPLALGTVIGIPIGVSILAYLNPTYLRLGVGVLLVLYTIYGLTRPVFAPMKIGTGTDIAIGISNGMLGGLTGLGGVISTISCQWRASVVAVRDGLAELSG
ncbi:sulfite exporter TauE/SafE family protein [Bradyrhizobium pachyrhizi]|uniref:sulfite exporter TauE/SafE family protein n=1 Tax=Bradyrhizobium pachyrhizi TaxID=280333 RepID=UPI003D36BDAD